MGKKFKDLIDMLNLEEMIECRLAYLIERHMILWIENHFTFDAIYMCRLLQELTTYKVNLYERKELNYEEDHLIEFVVSKNEKWYFTMQCCSCGYDTCYNIYNFDIYKIKHEIETSTVELNVDLTDYKLVWTKNGDVNA